MRYLLVATALGLLLGFVSGGRLRHLGSQTFRLWPVLAVGLGLQFAANAMEALAVEALLASYACLLAFAMANARLRGISIVAIGIALNAVVIGANGGMPVRAEALLAAGLADRDAIPVITDGKHHIEEPGDRLTVLADIIPVPPLEEVVSYGDLIQGVGLVSVLVHLMRPRRRRSRRPAAAVAARLSKEEDRVDVDEALRPYAVARVIDLTAEERPAVHSPA